MNPLVAIDPIESEGRTFELFCEAVGRFQHKGLLSEATIASTIHASLYVVPLHWYRQAELRYAKEARERIERGCQGRFRFRSATVLHSNSSTNEDLVAQLSRYGKRRGCDLMVVGSNNRRGLPHWILGSFAETAALSSALPVLVVKPHWKECSYSREMRLLLAIDVGAPPSASQLRWVADAARSARAKVDLAYVRPLSRTLTDPVRPSKRKDEAQASLEKIQAALRLEGVAAQAHVLDETRSVAHALAAFAETRKTWLTIATSAKRSLPYRLLLGSTARRLLALSERPFLGLRLEQ